MLLFVLILILVSSGLLILVVLAQNPKGGGLSSQFGGSGASNIIGVKKTSDLLEKLTWGFAIAILVLSLGSKALMNTPSTTEDTSPNLERAGEQQILPPILDSNDDNSGNAGDVEEGKEEEPGAED